MYILSMIILIFFAIIGLCAFVSTIAEMMCRCQCDNAVIILKNMNEENAEMQIRKAARIAMSEKGFRLICVCDRESAVGKISEAMQREYPIFEIMSKEEAEKAVAG